MTIPQEQTVIVQPKPRFMLWHVAAILSIMFAVAWLLVLFAPIIWPDHPLDPKTGDLGYAIYITLFGAWWLRRNGE